MGWTANFQNPATQYTTGQEFHLEYYLGQHLPKGFASAWQATSIAR